MASPAPPASRQDGRHEPDRVVTIARNGCAASTGSAVRHHRNTQAFCGSFAQAPSGACSAAPGGVNFHGSMEARVRSGAGSGNGKPAEYCWICGGLFWPTSMMRRRSAGMSVLATGALPRQKRGPCRRQDQARKGHKVAGFGRWPGYSARGRGAGSAGSIPGLGLPVGSDPVGEDRGYYLGPACPPARAATEATRPIGPGPGLR
jgi:hypothetical protein